MEWIESTGRFREGPRASQFKVVHFDVSLEAAEQAEAEGEAKGKSFIVSQASFDVPEFIAGEVERNLRCGAERAGETDSYFGLRPVSGDDGGRQDGEESEAPACEDAADGADIASSGSGQACAAAAETSAADDDAVAERTGGEVDEPAETACGEADAEEQRPCTSATEKIDWSEGSKQAAKRDKRRTKSTKAANTATSTAPAEVDPKTQALASLPADLELLEGEIGSVLWRDACEIFLKFLADYRPSYAGTNVVELGSGCGFVGVALAADGANVTITDMGILMPQMQLTRWANERMLAQGASSSADADAQAAPKSKDALRRERAAARAEARKAKKAAAAGGATAAAAAASKSAATTSAVSAENQTGFGRLHVAECDWLKRKIPFEDEDIEGGDHNYEIVLCCEVLYAGRDCWPGLRECLWKLSQRSNFKEVLLAVNLRVGRNDIDTFLGMLREDSESAPGGGPTFKDVERLFTSAESGADAPSAAPAEEAAPDGRSLTHFGVEIWRFANR